MSTPSNRQRTQEVGLETLATLAANRSASTEATRPRTRVNTALEEEEDYDRRCHAESPGADDSEEEDDHVGKNNFEIQMDQNQHEEDNLAALVDGAEVVGSSNTENQRVLEGAPQGWFPPGPPEGWQPKEPLVQKGEPASLSTIDSPGGWSPFTFRARFEGKMGT
jgi:hypothetical protein